MQLTTNNKNKIDFPRQANWGAVLAISLGAFIIITLEFLPVSLLTPIATDLRISDGYAGQSISISGLFAMLTSLFIATIMGNSDRRNTILFFTALMIVSGCVITFAPNAPVLMIGRVLVGIAVGGFWSISAATMMRLVPQESLPKAISILNGGNALATTFAAPLGAFLGGIIGWRGAFFCIVPVTVLTLIWQWRKVPSMPTTATEHRPVVASFKLLARRHVSLGMFAMTFLFLGQFMLFTYLRPFLETITKVDANGLSLILLGIGVSGFIGTVLMGVLLKKRLYSLLVPIPLIMSFVAVALTIYGSDTYITTLLLIVWGFLGTSAPVGWWTWLSKSLPHDAEAGGGLMVAIIQTAIMTGAAGGGFIYDQWGHQTTFLVSAACLVIGSVFAFMTWQSESPVLIVLVEET